MGVRSLLEQTIHAALRMVDIAGSTLDDAKGIMLDLLTDDGDDMDTTEDGEQWGIAGLQTRPKPGSAAEGYAKALRWRVGGLTFVIATFDPRHAEHVEEGEAIIHALGLDGKRRSLVRCKPDGVTEVEGEKITHFADHGEHVVDSFGILEGPPELHRRARVRCQPDGTVEVESAELDPSEPTPVWTPKTLIRCKPDGTVEIEGDAIKVGGSGATQGIALGDLLQTFVNVFWPPADGGSWTPVPNDGGAALQTALTTAFATGRPTVASAKHTVEP